MYVNPAVRPKPLCTLLRPAELDRRIAGGYRGIAGGEDPDREEEKKSDPTVPSVDATCRPHGLRGHSMNP